MSLEELLIHGQGISVHRKHINTLLTKIYKTFSGENPYLIKSIFTRKDVIYYLRTSNLLTLPKINTKRFGLYSFSFGASHLWNQLLDHMKYETSVKGFKNKLVKTDNKSFAHAQSAGFRTGNICHNNSCLLSICYVKTIALFYHPCVSWLTLIYNSHLLFTICIFGQC